MVRDVYDNLQTDFMGTKNNGHVHSYGNPILGDIVVNVSDLIKMIIKYFWCCKI